MELSAYGNTYEQLTELDFDRFKLASQAVRRYKLPPHKLPLKDLNYLFAVRSNNHPTEMFTAWSGIYVVIGFFLANLLYGGVHLIIWNRPFRGEIDELLWKLSSITILVSGIPTIMLFGYTSMLIRQQNMFLRYGSSVEDNYTFHNWLPRITGKLFDWVYLKVGVLLLLLYVFARVFIIVECFLDVFHLPDSAFEMPRWSQYFPHIG
jgi:glucan phosphoethanolaminetransferase (alkaline phosphatase superfamily)